MWSSRFGNHLLGTQCVLLESMQGDPDVLEALVPNLEELNLSRNLISDWMDYAFICQKIPSLRILHASRCRFSVPDDSECPTVACLTSLILNNCNLEFYKVREPLMCSTVVLMRRNE